MPPAAPACQSSAPLFRSPMIHQRLPGCRRHSLAMASSSSRATSFSARTRLCRAVPDGWQGGCYPRSSHGDNHLFANKTSILEASLTLGHSPS